MRNGIKALLLLAICTAAAGCEHDPQPKERPHDVPPTAVWAGGPDGGAYFNCSTGGTANQCTIWSDSTGDVVNSGRFTLENKNRGATSAELQFHGTDGRNILLADGLRLVPSK